MPPLPNQRQEQFCLLLVEGRSATDAYISAGYKSRGSAARVEASKCLAKGNVKARIAELRETAAKHAEITLDELARMAAVIYKEARQAGQYGASVAALKELGILTGKRIERREQGGPGDFDRMSDDELRAFIAIDVTPESAGEESPDAEGVEEEVRK